MVFGAVVGLVFIVALLLRRALAGAVERVEVTRSELAAASLAWRAPAELAGPRSRVVTFTQEGLWAVGFTVFALVAGGGLAVFLLRSNPTLAPIAADWTKVSGSIDGRHVSRGKTARHTLAFVYAKDGRSVRGAMEVSFRDYVRLADGAPIELRCLSSAPNRCRIEGLSDPNHDRWDLVYPPMFLLAGLAGAVLVSKQRRLSLRGRPLPAIVVRHRATRGHPEIRYRYLTPDGAEHEGSAHVPEALMPGVGVTTTVLVDPRHPSRSTFYPSIFFRVGEARRANGGPRR